MTSGLQPLTDASRRLWYDGVNLLLDGLWDLITHYVVAYVDPLGDAPLDAADDGARCVQRLALKLRGVQRRAGQATKASLIGRCLL